MTAYIDERGDLFIQVEGKNIHQKHLAKMKKISGVAPHPETGLIGINISSYIRYCAKELAEQLLEEMDELDNSEDE